MSEHGKVPILEEARTRFRGIVENRRPLDLEISVLATPLTPEEAIGVPADGTFRSASAGKGSPRQKYSVLGADLVLLTGTTIVNGTFDRIWEGIRGRKRDYLLYGVTAAGVSEPLGLERICPCGRDG